MEITSFSVNEMFITTPPHHHTPPLCRLFLDPQISPRLRGPLAIAIDAGASWETTAEEIDDIFLGDAEGKLLPTASFAFLSIQLDKNRDPEYWVGSHRNATRAVPPGLLHSPLPAPTPDAHTLRGFLSSPLVR